MPPASRRHRLRWLFDPGLESRSTNLIMAMVAGSSDGLDRFTSAHSTRQPDAAPSGPRTGEPYGRCPGSTPARPWPAWMQPAWLILLLSPGSRILFVRSTSVTDPAPVGCFYRRGNSNRSGWNSGRLREGGTWPTKSSARRVISGRPNDTFQDIRRKCPAEPWPAGAADRKAPPWVGAAGQQNWGFSLRRADQSGDNVRPTNTCAQRAENNGRTATFMPSRCSADQRQRQCQCTKPAGRAANRLFSSGGRNLRQPPP